MEEIERIIHISPDFIERIRLKEAQNNISGKFQLGEDNKEHDMYCMTGGQKGKIRVWNISSGREININQGNYIIPGVGVQHTISDLHMTNNEKNLYVVQDDIISQVNFEINCETKAYDVNLTSTNQYEVLDFAILDSYLIVATTSSVLKIYEFTDSSQGRLICVSSDQNGHSDAILAVSAVLENQEHFVTCGKDQSVCLWKLFNENNKVKIKVIAKGIGHSSYVGAVTANNESIYSASKDGVLKLWGWPNASEEQDQDGNLILSSKRNIAAHASGKSIKHLRSKNPLHTNTWLGKNILIIQ